MIFGVVVVGPMPGPYDLGGILWHAPVASKHFPDRNFVFVILQLEIAPGNAANDPLNLEYS